MCDPNRVEARRDASRATTSMQRSAPIALEDGWEVVRRGVDKLEKLLEGEPEAEGFKADEYMNIYTCVLDQERRKET